MALRYSLILVLLMSGCSTINSYTALPYDQLKTIRVHNSDCARLDDNVNYVEDQLRRKGILGKNPEDLNFDDRQYNSTARIIVWSLRIGCNNTDRYAS